MITSENQKPDLSLSAAGAVTAHCLGRPFVAFLGRPLAALPAAGWGDRRRRRCAELLVRTPSRLPEPA